MKVNAKIIPLVTAVALLCPILSHAAELGSLDATIQILQEQINRQIERIQAARQKADSQMTLARARVAQQLDVAQQELAVQVEKLQQLRAQLQDKTTETEANIAYWQSQGTALISKTLSDVSRQINETTQLMQKLDQLKTQIDCNCPNGGGAGQGAIGPQSDAGTVLDAPAADATASPGQNVAMLTFPDAEPLAFPPLSPTG
uniref:Uncharacterized protein n=1 Tax=Desulfomonile tiedjei TaxID=2358 RepID=A0A7C4ERL6_9BACT